MSEQAYTTFRVRVLLVDDERALLEPMREFLSRYYSVEAALSGNEALQLVESQHGEFDVALIDESLMPGPSGIEVMKTIRASYPNMEVIIFTGWGSEQRQNALRAGAFRYLEKPVNKEELVLLIRSAAQQVRFHAINREMLASRGLDGLQNAIINAACSLVFADDAAIVYTNPLSGKEVIHKSNAAEHATPCFRHHLENTDLTRKIMQEGVPFSLPDTDGRSVCVQPYFASL
jgi:CheY-like chemotaxis protein